ncbi:ECF sigma factor [Planctomycetes bacterium K2D]|uniref:ECF sigma factor n=2 Tax=Botrimarina mediterranea TaxID=2528022 RepID=A0A518K277_9BACT|nr:ECF sigma factor [Botrimarina mediterranea]QDV76454.1 ECF sigma factor [Planctomycetes bacterium K2D]
MGRFADVQNRDELWWLLLAISRQKVVDLHRSESALKRGGGRVRTESALQASYGRDLKFSLDQLVGDEPTPESLLVIDEQQRRLLGMLRDDVVRRVAIARIEGYTVSEIAGELAISPRSVERKLQLIRKRWAEDLGNATSSASV